MKFAFVLTALFALASASPAQQTCYTLPNGTTICPGQVSPFSVSTTAPLPMPAGPASSPVASTAEPDVPHGAGCRGTFQGGPVRRVVGGVAHAVFHPFQTLKGVLCPRRR